VARDKSAKMASQIQLLVCRDQAPAACAANSGPFAIRREISLNAGMRGGPGRTRTRNQTVMSGDGPPEKIRKTLMNNATPDGVCSLLVTP
jgi:hypothetical protein